MSGLAMDRVSKFFGGVHAVSELSLKVPLNRITGLIGPNGAGKSTVVNLITRMFASTSGTMTFEGLDITRVEPHDINRLGIARTFQNIRLLADETVLHNTLIGYHRHERTGVLSNMLGWPSALRETRLAQDKARDLLSRFQLADKADFRAGSLSYGDQRRVEMVRALMSDPKLLLLDEPVAGMNEVESAALGAEFQRVADSGVAVLLIEHDLKFVSRLCAHVYAVDQGRLICEGEPSTVLTDAAVIEAYVGEEHAQD